jgi:ribulose-5-phosphate 4-epimerase/fuculose-1-phosphate aldolase
MASQIELRHLENIRPFTGEAGSIRHRVDPEEWRIRQDLAALYRLVALYGWDDLVFTHISCRLPGSERHFLINPYGLLFEEVTASNLVKIDVKGFKLDDSPYPVNPAGFAIHRGVHLANEDAHCVLHLHTADGVAVASQEAGLLPITQSAMIICGDLAYHDFGGPGMHDDEGEHIARDLGDKHNMIMRGHGTLSVGKTCADAFMRAYGLEKSCTCQIRAQSGGGALHRASQGWPEMMAEIVLPSYDGPFGELAWPALLRRLERIDPSYKN